MPTILAVAANLPRPSARRVRWAGAAGALSTSAVGVGFMAANPSQYADPLTYMIILPVFLSLFAAILWAPALLLSALVDLLEREPSKR